MKKSNKGRRRNSPKQPVKKLSSAELGVVSNSDETTAAPAVVANAVDELAQVAAKQDVSQSKKTAIITIGNTQKKYRTKPPSAFCQKTTLTVPKGEEDETSAPEDMPLTDVNAVSADDMKAEYDDKVASTGVSVADSSLTETTQKPTTPKPLNRSASKFAIGSLNDVVKTATRAVSKGYTTALEAIEPALKPSTRKTEALSTEKQTQTSEHDDEVRREKQAALEKARIEYQEAESAAAKLHLNHIAAALSFKETTGKTRHNSLPNRLLLKVAPIIRTLEKTFKDARLWLARKGITNFRDVGTKIAESQNPLEAVAFSLRIGLGTLFVIGGWNKLSKLLSPANSDAIVASYTSTTGYINEFFMGFLFSAGSAISPWSFLTTLSAFELVTGLMLLAGLLVRPVALIYAFLLWSFVIALPVVTTNGVNPGVNTYMAPALLVQIRDVALSGIMFALYGLGSGVRSLDYKIFGPEAIKPRFSSDVVGVLLRFSAASVLIVGGLFAGMPNIKTYIEPGFLLVAAGLAILWGGHATRYAAVAMCAVLLGYMLGKVGIDKGMLGSFNAIKRELALFAVAFVIAARDWGSLWTASDIANRFTSAMALAYRNLSVRLDQASQQSSVAQQ